MDGVEVPARVAPSAADRGNAEALVGLPWVTWPSTPAACDKALDSLAVLEESAPAELLTFWSSLKRYISALRERVAPTGPAPPMVANKTWKNTKQSRLVGKVIA